MQRQIKTRRAFSLVELCVSIGIVLVLLGILLPILTRMRRSADTAACASSLSQIGKGLSTYSSENRGFIPRALVTIPIESTDSMYSGVSAYPSFVSYLTETYRLGGESARKLLVCRRHNRSDGVETSYVINGVGITSDADFVDLVAELPAAATEIGRIQRPSDVPYVMDGSDYFDQGNWGGNPFGDSVYITDAHFLSCNAHLIGQINQRIAESRHGKGLINCLYFDGSVRLVESMEIDLRTLDDGVRGRHHIYYGWQVCLP